MTSPAPMTDAQKSAAFREFIARNGPFLTDGAPDLYRLGGRGFWLAATTGPVGPPHHRGCKWVTASDYEQVADDDTIDEATRADVTRQVSSYDPERQWVLVLGHRDGSTSSYVLPSAPIGRG